MGPMSASVSWINRSRSSGLDRSAAMATACPPFLVTACTVSSRLPSNWLVPGSIVLAVTATVAPSAAKRSAIAIPIPRLAPVTRAVRPVRRLLVIDRLLVFLVASPLPADFSVNELTDQVRVAVVPGVLLNHVNVDPPERARFTAPSHARVFQVVGCGGLSTLLALRLPKRQIAIPVAVSSGIMSLSSISGSYQM